MKNLLSIKALVLLSVFFLFVKSGFAQNDADPAITSMSFAQSPITIGNTTTLTVFFLNNGFTTPITAGSVGLNISLPTNGDYVAFPASTAAISGSYASHFNWSYNSGTNTFFGITNSAVGPGDGGTIVVTVKGMNATAQTISVANIQRINPSQYPNENINNNNLTAWLAVTPGGPLPITLLNFTAAKQNGSVSLNWQTSNESNSKDFEVQFSRDGTSWQTLGTVIAAGYSTSTRSYSYVHTTPVNGINYYRIKMVDMDNRFTYSDTRTVEFSTKSRIVVMPNPVTDQVYITSNKGGNLQSVAIIAADGRIVQTLGNFVSGRSVSMGRYPSGIYTLRITRNSGEVEVLKLVKQ